MSEYRHLLVEARAEVLWLRINRPRMRNALSRDTLDELRRACEAHAEDPGIKAMVISGTGTAAFAAGGDLKELATVRSADEAGAFFDETSNAIDAVRRFPLPTVAALNGLALGGGAELALACDFRVALPAAAIGYIHARLNISCGFGGGTDLIGLLGPAGAMAHGLRAETMTAAQALGAGLVDLIAAEDEALDDCVLQFLEPMLRQNRQVIRAYKAFASAARRGLGPEQKREIEREWFLRTWTHPDHWTAADEVMSGWQT